MKVEIRAGDGGGGGDGKPFYFTNPAAGREHNISVSNNDLVDLVIRSMEINRKEISHLRNICLAISILSIIMGWIMVFAVLGKIY